MAMSKLRLEVKERFPTIRAMRFSKKELEEKQPEQNSRGILTKFLKGMYDTLNCSSRVLESRFNCLISQLNFALDYILQTLKSLRAFFLECLFSTLVLHLLQRVSQEAFFIKVCVWKHTFYPFHVLCLFVYG